MFCPPLRHIETGALLLRILIVAMQPRLGEDALQHLDKHHQRTLLCPVEGVARTASAVQPSDIANSDAVLVVAIGMGTDYLYRPPDMDGTVEIDEVVIANIVEPPFQMAATYVLDRIGAILAGGRTMDDDVVDFSHIER